MLENEKALLKQKYGHNKWLLAVHMLGKYIKDIYHAPRFHTKISMRGQNNRCPYVPRECTVKIIGDNNTVEIDPSVKIFKGEITVGDFYSPASNCRVYIGKNCTSNGTNIVLMEDGTTVSIGDDCMFSWGVDFFVTDFHTICARDTTEIINKGKELTVADHVWIAMHATILKNSYIAKNSIVGAYAVVAGKFTEENCVLAGNPARVVKRQVCWHREWPNRYQADSAGGYTEN